MSATAHATTQHILFVTGRLAEQAVRDRVASLADKFHFAYSIQVLPITVAALMTPKFLMRHLQIPADIDRVILPGYLADHLAELRLQCDVRLECGPRDIRDLPIFFGEESTNRDGYGDHSITILAEINHAPKLSLEQLLHAARRYRDEGADLIDLGCTPGHRWLHVADAVRALREEGLRVSIDSFDSREVADACRAGAELVLSVNSSNRSAAVDWGCEVVAIPDTPRDEKSLGDTIEFLSTHGLAYRIDPILEPIGFGFIDSLLRYAQWRSRLPDATMLMGIGNLTELTDVDSAGINVLLMAICQELNVQSVLTTSVINWGRSSIRECAIARELVHFACTQKVPPKNLERRLVMLRDPRVNEHSLEIIESIGQSIRDRNVRILNAAGEIHALSANVHARGVDPFDVMRQLLASELGKTITTGHAFYLGFEMAKAMIANQLGKRYEQDQALEWGFLTIPEDHHRLRD
jgi:dihydropteroate synthase-like protein